MKTVDINDIILTHRDISELLGKRSTSETIERCFLTILGRRLSDYLVERWRKQGQQGQQQGQTWMKGK